jgi:hypothetical protein
MLSSLQCAALEADFLYKGPGKLKHTQVDMLVSLDNSKSMPEFVLSSLLLYEPVLTEYISEKA